MAVAVRLFLQSWVQIRTDEHLIYLDPSNMNSMGDFLAGAFSSGVRSDKLPDHLEPGDLILITHHHQDHVKKGLVEHLSRPGAKVLGPSKCRRTLGDAMDVVAAGEIRTIGDLKVQVVQAYNPVGSRRMTYHKKGVGVGYIIEVEGRRIYHAGDTGLIEEMNGFGPVDVAFLPIGGRFTMDVKEAVEAVTIIKPSLAIPMHMLRSDPQEFKSLVEGTTPSKVAVLAPGATRDVL
jgi:L-ascorbate metabolism protein UlaG (beta-lactamase superfamily)